MTRHLFISLALGAALLAVPATVPTAAAATSVRAQRCAAMTGAVNARRAPADLRTLTILCRVAERRAYEMVDRGYFAHDVRPAQMALTAAGIKWCKIGEALAWRSVWQTSTSWATDWWGSTGHRALLNDARFDYGAGSYTGVRSYYPHAVAVYYTVDLC